MISIFCINLILERQSYINILVSAHCTVLSNVLTVTDENHKRCIFPILPVNVLRSYLGFK